AEERMTFGDRLLEEIGVVGIGGFADRGLEDLTVADADRVGPFGRPEAGFGAARDAAEDAGEGFEAKAGAALFSVRSGDRLLAFDEILIAHRLVESDELDAPCLAQPPIARHEVLAPGGHRLDRKSVG